MARTITAIYNEIIAAKDASADLAGLTSTSKSAIYKLWAYIQATSMWTLEVLFDEHQATINEILDNEKPHTLKWYVLMAKQFQYGRALVTDEDYYDNTGVSDEDIETEQVVKFAAAVEVAKGIKLKVSTLSGGDLAPLDAPEYAAFQTYMQRIKDAGVKLFFQNDNPDSLVLDLKIYYDPLVLDATGQRLDGTGNTPVQDAVTEFLETEITYNGLFVLAYLVDYLQAVPGVVIPHVVSAEATYGALPYTTVDVEYQPDAGYLRILDPGDLTIEFIAHEPV